MTLRPDIVLLILDTQRADRLSSYGCPFETSPYFDELASDATLFSHAFSPAQWTVPSHSSMFTGVYPSAHNTLHASSILPASLPTLAERLRDSGYFTSAFCNNPLVGIVNNGLRRGFQSFLNYGGWMTSRPNQAGMHPNPVDRYRQHFKRLLASTLSSMQDVFARSDTMLDISMSPLMVPLWQTALRFKGNTAKSLNDAARLLIERNGIEEGQPIFSFINLMGTHLPYHPPRRYVEKFAPYVLHDKSAQRYLQRFNSDVFGWIAPLENHIEEKDRTTLIDMYTAEVAYQDELLGEFIRKLRSNGTLDNTLLIICADHGEHLGEKEMIGHSFSIYNELVKVPLLIRDPAGNLPRGAVVDHFVSTRRVFHTALTAAERGTESEQMLTLAQSPTSDPDGGVVFAEAIPPLNVLNLVQRRKPEMLRNQTYHQTRRAVWNEKHKLIQVGEDRLELYSVFDDPYEKSNLRDILPERVKTLQERLGDFVNHAGVIAPAAEYSAGYDDPEVEQRLRDLGYLE